jgi:DNA-binding transcriptional ArsR family regulator
MSAGLAPTLDDDLWSAVGDPTRRRLLDLLLRGESTATALGRQLPVTRQAVAKHLAVLDRAGLVCSQPAGRERRYQVDQAQLARAVAQLSSVGAAWDARLQRIKRIAEDVQRQENHRRHRNEKVPGTHPDLPADAGHTGADPKTHENTGGSDG